MAASFPSMSVWWLLIHPSRTIKMAAFPIHITMVALLPSVWAYIKMVATLFFHISPTSEQNFPKILRSVRVTLVPVLKQLIVRKLKRLQCSQPDQALPGLFLLNAYAQDIRVCAHATVLGYGSRGGKWTVCILQRAMKRVTVRACVVPRNTLTALRRPRW
jgi:hypothetical protein